MPFTCLFVYSALHNESIAGLIVGCRRKKFRSKRQPPAPSLGDHVNTRDSKQHRVSVANSSCENFQIARLACLFKLP